MSVGEADIWCSQEADTVSLQYQTLFGEFLHDIVLQEESSVSFTYIGSQCGLC